GRTSAHRRALSRSTSATYNYQTRGRCPMRSKMLSYLGGLTLMLPWVIGAPAQALTPSPTPQFAFTGFIQAATLDTTGAICKPPNDQTGQPSDRLRGGTITVNGITMIVPCNSIIQF